MNTWQVPWTHGPRTGRSRVVCLLLLCLAPLTGQIAIAEEHIQDVDITEAHRAKIIERVASTIEKHYVYEDMAKRMVGHIRTRSDNGAYDSVSLLSNLIAQLVQDLRSISHDQHISIYPYQKPADENDADALERRQQASVELKRENYGFLSVEILPGNIGYVDIFQFYDPKDAAQIAIAAMNFLSNSDALIIDLRKNGGGYETMRQLICSYLFAEPTHLIDHYYRDGSSDQTWTLPYVSGPRMDKIPVYVLVGRRTFSAAEGFAFSLKNRGRGVVIGQRTRGGAHPVEYYRFAEESITVRVPYGRAADPVTGDNWEGVGVVPDIEVAAGDDAYIVANIEAISGLLSSEDDDSHRYLLEWALDDYESQLNPMDLEELTLIEYAGDYEGDRVTFEYGDLYYHRQNGWKRLMIPMRNNGFKIHDRSGYSKYRIQFVRDSSGEITGFYLHAHDGDRYPVMSRHADE